MADTRRMDAYGDAIGNYNFRVEIDGIDAGQFQGVDGLGMELEVIEYQNGDDSILRKRPGRTKFNDVTLKKGYIATTILHDWIDQARLGNGQYERKLVSVVLHDNGDPMNDPGGSEIKRWNLYECWPKSWKVTSLDGKGTDILVEEVVIVTEWFEEA